MYLQLQSKSRFLDLHLTSGLHDWDMNEEIKLTTTTDQFYHGKIISVRNSLQCAKQGRLFNITEVSWFGRWQADWPVSGAVALCKNLQKVITGRSTQKFPAPAQRQRCVPQTLLSWHHQCLLNIKHKLDLPVTGFFQRFQSFFIAKLPQLWFISEWVYFLKYIFKFTLFI